MKPKPLKYRTTLERTNHFHDGRLALLRLDGNELSPHIGEDFLIELKRRLTADHLSAYPELRPIYKSLSAHVGLPEEHVLVTSGCEGALRSVFDCFVTTGSTVVSVTPTYGMYEVYAHLYGARFISVEMNESFEVSVEDLIAAIGDESSLVIIANPNGATGSYLTIEQIQRIYSRVEEVGALLVIDEAYIEFAGQPSFAPLVANLDNLVVTRSCSKGMGLAGMRAGYLLASLPVRDVLMRSKSLYELSSVAILAVQIILDSPEIMKRNVSEVAKGKLVLAQAFEQRGISCVVGSANFILVKLGQLSGSFKMFCKDRRILIRDHPPNSLLSDYVRISVGQMAAVEAVCKIIDEYFMGASNDSRRPSINE